jgi:hypothetical protein
MSSGRSRQPPLAFVGLAVVVVLTGAGGAGWKAGRGPRDENLPEMARPR